VLIEVHLEFDVMSGKNFSYCIPLSITNEMQRYTLFFITVNAVHVSDGFSAHHQEHKTVHTASGICQACLLLPLKCDFKFSQHY
jgi:hypothetical protein